MTFLFCGSNDTCLAWHGKKSSICFTCTVTTGEMIYPVSSRAEGACDGIA